MYVGVLVMYEVEVMIEVSMSVMRVFIDNFFVFNVWFLWVI